MHIEPGIVEGAKMTLGYVTAITVFGYTAKLALSAIKRGESIAFGVRSLIAAVLVFSFFEVFPHYPVGVSEVHLILGSTLFLMFGAAPAAVGLALGLLAQGFFFASWDLPQYGMNVTTLLVPLFALNVIARRYIPANIAYKDVKYSQCLALSAAYQGGVVAWVAFWAIYGQGAGAANLAQIGTFGAAYVTIVLVEPLLDLAILAAVKGLHQLQDSMVFQQRFYRVSRVGD